MPTYEYKCKACDHRWELFQSMSAKPERKCPACGKAKAERLIGTGAALLFKGSGFYITDYRGDGYKKAAEADSKAAAGGGSSAGAAGGASGSGAPSETKSGAAAPGSASGSAGGKSAESVPAPSSKPANAGGDSGGAGQRSNSGKPGKPASNKGAK